MHPYLPYLNWIDSQKQTLMQRVKQWVAINTFSWNVQGLNQLLPLLQSAFKSLEGESTSIQIPSQEKMGSDGNMHMQPLGQALVIRKRTEAPIQILLGGHIDTVYSPDSPFQNLEEQDINTWKGPGVADMKGGIAILLTALEALERSPFAAQIGWEVLLTPDEEIGSLGSGPLYAAAAQRHQFGLIFEPSLPDGAFVNQRKGSANYTVIVHGRAAHVGRDFAYGRSAVFALAHFIHLVEILFKDQDLTLNVAELKGEGPLNIIPPLASCRLNLRSANASILDNACQELQHFAQQLESEGIQIEVIQDSLRTPKPFDSPTQQLFEVYASCAQQLNIPFQMRATGGVCDGNILAEAGLPTLDTAGVVGGALHTPDEYIFLPSLVKRAQLATLFLFTLASMKKENVYG